MTRDEEIRTKTNAELLPTKEEHKDIKFWDYAFIWGGMAINMGAFTMGAQYYPGLSPLDLIWAILIGYGFVTLVNTMTGDVGIVYGVPFAVYLRTCFGYKGCTIPAIIRAIPCWFWYGYQTWVGGAAMNVILSMWVGYSNVTVLMLILCAAQVVNAAMGVKAIAKFDWIAIPLLALLLGALTFWLLKSNDVTIVDIFSIKAEGGGSFWMAVTSIAGIWITMALNNMDITRELKDHNGMNTNPNFLVRNCRVVGGAVIGLITCGAGILVVGMISGILTGVWDPVEMITTAIPNPIIMFLAMLVIVFAQWSTVTSGCLLPGSLILITAFPKLNYKTGVVLSGIIGMLMFPWLFNDYLTYITVIFSAMLGPIGGIVIADYYLLRKRKLNVSALYDQEAIPAFNGKALGVYFLSFALCFIYVDLAFFIGLFGSFVIYYLVMRNSFVNNYVEPSQPL